MTAILHNKYSALVFLIVCFSLITFCGFFTFTICSTFYSDSRSFWTVFRFIFISVLLLFQFCSFQLSVLRLSACFLSFIIEIFHLTFIFHFYCFFTSKKTVLTRLSTLLFTPLLFSTLHFAFVTFLGFFSFRPTSNATRTKSSQLISRSHAAAAALSSKHK